MEGIIPIYKLPLHYTVGETLDPAQYYDIMHTTRNKLKTLRTHVNGTYVAQSAGDDDVDYHANDQLSEAYVLLSPGGDGVNMDGFATSNDSVSGYEENLIFQLPTGRMMPDGQQEYEEHVVEGTDLPHWMRRHGISLQDIKGGYEFICAESHRPVGLDDPIIKLPNGQRLPDGLPDREQGYCHHIFHEDSIKGWMAVHGVSLDDVKKGGKGGKGFKNLVSGLAHCHQIKQHFVRSACRVPPNNSCPFLDCANPTILKEKFSIRV